jgi:type 1 glutamine amidotransferase
MSMSAILAAFAIATAPHVVFVTGDEEYRSEESMPMLAKILQRDYGFKVTVCYAVGEDGTINPNRLDHIEGLEALDNADLLVMFTRYRALPDDQLKRIVAFVESGKPVVGFRTATHAFKYPSGPNAQAMNDDWPSKVFGQKWITHHGHFGDGHEKLTAVGVIPERKDHPILRGVEPFQVDSWLYHVQGGGDSLSGDSEPLLIGKALKSSHDKETDRFPLTNPVAWTKTYTGSSGKPARVFFTTLGHPYDFKEPSMRKLTINGILWALGREDTIPSEGAKAEPVEPYDPPNSGVPNVYRKGVKPRPIVD